MDTAVLAVVMGAASVVIVGGGYSVYETYQSEQQSEQVAAAGTYAYPGSRAFDPQLVGLAQDGNSEKLITQPSVTGGLDIVAIASAAVGDDLGNAPALSVEGSSVNVCPVTPAEWQAALTSVHRDGTATVSCNSAGEWSITGRDANDVSTGQSRVVTVSGNVSGAAAGRGFND